MKTEKLVEQLDLYANAIVAFMVAQSVAFSFTFGTNAAFGCRITQYRWLAAALIAHFMLSTCLAAWALKALARRMSELSNETESPLTVLGHETLRFAARAKSIVCVLFALLPIGLLLFFGLLGQADTGCSRQAAATSAVRDAA